jgi:hypothetical protein
MRCRRENLDPIMPRRLIVALLVAVVGVGSAPIVVDFGSTDAVAQSRKEKRPSLFERLFDSLRGNREPRSVPRIRKVKPRNTAPPVPVVEVVPKDPDARKVLVIGDFVAGGLAWGLEQAFADEPKLVVIDQSKANSGLVRADHFDWNASLPNILNETQPDLIVMTLGANDRQEFRDGNVRAAIRSDDWVAAYTTRISGIVDTLNLYGRPFFWVGAPPMRATSASSDMAYVNGLYKPRVQAGGGHFVDIWNGFANEDGRYVSSGPDVEGQVRQLRTSDGINFTRAGRLKLAFYVDREIRRQTGFGSGGIDLLATVTQGNRIEIGPDGTKRLVGPIISLNDPLPGLSGDLVGAEAPISPAEESLQFKMIVRGESLPQAAGRADDFSWPPQGTDALLPSVIPEPLAEASVPVPIARPEGVAN